VSTGSNYTLFHFDANDTWGNVNQGWIVAIANLPYAPASFYAVSQGPITLEQFTTIMKGQLNLLNPDLVSGYSINELNLHIYYPFPTNDALRNPVGGGFYGRFNSLQGRRNTFWVGTLQAGLCAHHSIIEANFRLMAQHFPMSNGKREVE